MTLRETFIKYLEHRVADGRPVFASHDMGDARMWVMYKSGKSARSENEHFTLLIQV